MENQQLNRVEIELNQWREREDRFKKLFEQDLSTNRQFQREKLHFYDHIVARYKGSRDLDEQFMLLVLKQERNAVEKTLYPNLWLRLFRRLLVISFRERNIMKKDAKIIEKNSQVLRQSMQRAGFTGLSQKVDEMIQKGHQQFSIPVSYYVDEVTRLDHQLSFARDNTGQYIFEGFKSSLFNEHKPQDSKMQYFSTEYSYDIFLARNLLEGRAVLKDGTWLQLDFNDKDKQGNYVVKEFQSSYGYDLENVVQRLPLKEVLERESLEKLLAGLKSGHREPVVLIRDGKEQRNYIEANPRSKSVTIFDGHSRRITLHTALGNKTMEPIKIETKNGLQHETDKKHNSNMRIS